LADTEDIYVTKNGKPLAKLTTARIDKLAAAESLFDILPSHVELDHAREERLR
jgi:antitoxin (DNA-binding transcriptional repressor) of toxin-antitoxin stability system